MAMAMPQRPLRLDMHRSDSEHLHQCFRFSICGVHSVPSPGFILQPVHNVWVYPPGPSNHHYSVSPDCEQPLLGNGLVPTPSVLRHHKRHHGLHVWLLPGANQAHRR